MSRNRWTELIEKNPEHSSWYVERFRTMAANGDDLAGEARCIDAMVGRGARVLDAGCGPGRVGGYLHQAGHEVVGVDLDPVLIEAAELDHPGPTWLVADLSEFDLPAAGISEGFDIVVCAGNVMTFLHPATRRVVLQRLRAHLRPAGRIVVGFGANRGYEFADFFDDAVTAGVSIDATFASWDLRPFTDDSGWLVAVLSTAAT